MKAQSIKLQRSKFSSFFALFTENAEEIIIKFFHESAEMNFSFLMQANADNLHFLSFTFPANVDIERNLFICFRYRNLSFFCSSSS